MDMKLLMRQAQEMQKKMQKAQEEIAKMEFHGSAGGDMVKISITGDGMAKKIDIDPSLLKGDEKDILEDLIIAAFNNAKQKADSGSSDSLKSVTNGINLPKGFNF